MSPNKSQQTEVRLLARACDRAGLSTAYGHCSLRLDAKSFLVCAARPMGLITHEDGDVVPLDGPLPDGVLGEVRMHREIYRLRPDVNSIVRFISPNVTALAALGRTPRPRHGLGAYFAPAVPMWMDIGLVRNDAAAEGVAKAFGASSGIVVSINGAIVGGVDSAQALALAIFLEDAARVELAALNAGCSEHPGLTAEQSQSRAVWGGQIAERLWQYWIREDPERAEWERSQH
jgi:HCOMODA/2-hydroxy-3-carboxy-muconic semialdehyde decarboxylase